MGTMMYEEEWYCCQEEQGPLWKSSTRDCDLATVTYCTFNVTLINDVNTGLRVSTDSHTRQKCVS